MIPKDEYIIKLARAEAEIGRLRALIADNPEGRFDTSGEVQKLRAELDVYKRRRLEEIERLRQVVDHIKVILEGLYEEG